MIKHNDCVIFNGYKQNKYYKDRSKYKREIWQSMNRELKSVVEFTKMVTSNGVKAFLNLTFVQNQQTFLSIFYKF